MVPVPSQDSFAADSDNSVSAPTLFYDEEQRAGKDDNILANEVYGEDDSGRVPEEGIVAQSRYYGEEEGAAKDDSILSHDIYGEDDSGIAPEEGIVGQSRYYAEQESAEKDNDILAHSIYGEDDSGKTLEEGITSQSLYYSEEEGASKKDDVLAQSVYNDDDSAAAPEEVASEPEEKVAQAEEASPVTVLPVTVTVEASPLFDFDRSAIRGDASKKLDALARQLKNVKYGEIVAVGYADPIGAPMHNQRLSEQRAAAVKDYLIKLGIAADKIKVEGRGETEQYADLKACGGVRSQKTIACLQPDRRVEVTVNAHKDH
jgi:outer membrane protein OmpA-like peptidoglycan-associated protein